MRGGLFTFLFFASITSIPILVAFWRLASSLSPRMNEKARYPGRGIEHYLEFKREEDREKYYGKKTIPMHTFHEMYFDGLVEFKGDCLEVMEYRHDWANFQFTWGLFWYFFSGFLPEVIVHSRSQGTDYQPSR